MGQDNLQLNVIIRYTIARFLFTRSNNENIGSTSYSCFCAIGTFPVSFNNIRTSMWLIAQQPKFLIMFLNSSAIISYMVARYFSLSLLLY